MIYTVGHSTLEIPEFLKVVADLTTIWDIRSHPGSIHPQFNKEAMETWLPQNGKEYIWEPRLGGWRDVHISLAEKFEPYGVNVKAYSGRKFPKQQIAASRTDREPSWTNVGLYEYSFFMMLPEFHDAAAELVERGKKENVGICCAECLWWKCHRSMVADYLYFNGVEAIHLQPKLTFHPKVIGNRIERYHPAILENWASNRITH